MRGACPVARYRQQDRRAKPLHRYRGAHRPDPAVHSNGRRQGTKNSADAAHQICPYRLISTCLPVTWIAKLFFGFFQKIDSEGFLSIAVELVESDAIDFEKAQLAIEELGRAGIKSYIDDFGTGYSSIERVARLAVYGVKLDRSFAMSPPDSVLGRMLVQVIDMIKTSGHLIVCRRRRDRSPAQSAALHRRCRLRPGIRALAPARH